MSAKDPGILRSAPLGRVNDERPLPERDARQTAWQYPAFRTGDGERPQIDMPGLDPVAGKRRRDREVETGLANVVGRIC